MRQGKQRLRFRLLSLVLPLVLGLGAFAGLAIAEPEPLLVREPGAPAARQPGRPTVAEPRRAAQQAPACQYRPVRHEIIDGVGVTVIERIASSSNRDEHRVRVWIDDTEHRVWKVELLNDLDQPLYTVRYLRYEREGDEWRPAAVYLLDQGRREARVVRELDEIAGIKLDDVRSAAVRCASLN